MIEVSALICLVMVIAQAWKKLGLNRDLIPLLNVISGLFLSLLFFNELEILCRIQQGVMIGLAASGIYDIGTCFKKIYQ